MVEGYSVSMDDDEKLRRDLLAETRRDLLARNLSNSEKYDGAILTLSMAALGLSLTLIKGRGGLELSVDWICLFLSWCFFGLAIVSTICSFLVSQQAINKQIEYAEKYYLEREEEYLTKKSPYHVLTDWFNYLSGVSFVTAIMLTIVFVSTSVRGV